MLVNWFLGYDGGLGLELLSARYLGAPVLYGSLDKKIGTLMAVKGPLDVNLFKL